MGKDYEWLEILTFPDNISSHELSHEKQQPSNNLNLRGLGVLITSTFLKSITKGYLNRVLWNTHNNFFNFGGILRYDP